MLHLDSSLGAGVQVGGVLLTSQAFFKLQGMLPQLYTRVDAHRARARLYYQLKMPWCFLWIWPAEGSWYLFIAAELNIGSYPLHR
jgi:hypothetical protein